VPIRPRISVARTVRTHRAYFHCRFGQLHVRTAFPATGGFDEGVTLFCVHPSEGSSRTFERFLPEIADNRPVYAPDLPGFGESDPAFESPLTQADAAGALADLARDLRLRQIDVLGFRCGGRAALELAAITPELVRRLVLIAVPPTDRLPTIREDTLVLRITPGSAGDFDAATATLAGQIRDFLR
jgi:pimeloyl-ACP methyl ester carboxylesterase